MVESTRAYWVVAKHVLRYLRGIIEFGLRYRQFDGVRLEGLGSSTDMKSTSECTFSVGSTIVSWFS